MSEYTSAHPTAPIVSGSESGSALRGRDLDQTGHSSWSTILIPPPAALHEPSASSRAMSGTSSPGSSRSWPPGRLAVRPDGACRRSRRRSEGGWRPFAGAPSQRTVGSSRTFRTIANSATGRGGRRPAGVLERELSDESRIPGRPCPVGQGDQLVERLGIRVTDRSKPAEVAGPRDQCGAYLSRLYDASIHDVPFEDDEGRNWIPLACSTSRREKVCCRAALPGDAESPGRRPAGARDVGTDRCVATHLGILVA